MQETSSIPVLVLIFCRMALFIKVHVWTHLNKMVWQNAKIDIFLRWLDLYSSLLIFSNDFGGETVLTTTYLINRMPSRILKFKTSVQTFLEHFPKSYLVSQIPLKVFGCSVFVHIHSQYRGKLNARAKKCIFVGYSSNKKGYKCYCPTSKKFFHSMNVSFFENIPYFFNSMI